MTLDTDAAPRTSRSEVGLPTGEPPKHGTSSRRLRRIVTLCSLLTLPIAAVGSACVGDSGDGNLAASGGDGAVAEGSPDSGVAAQVDSAAGAGGATEGAGGAGGRSSESMGGTGPVSLAGAAGSTGTAGNGSLPTGEGTDPGAGETGATVGMTAAHNAARAAEMLNPPLPDLTWSTDLAAVAQDWANTLATQCGTIMHRMPNKYGENIADKGTTGTLVYPPGDAVASWVSEKMCWDYGTINGTEKCDMACYTSVHSNGCGHYTQVIWRDTKRVGCGYSECQAAQFKYGIWVCNYDPPGNYVGETPY